MQALRARIDVLQSRLPPSHRQTSLERHASEGEQNMLSLQNFDDSKTLRGIGCSNLQTEGRFQALPQSSTFGKITEPTAIRSTFDCLYDSRSRLRHRGVSRHISRFGQANVSSIQSQPAAVKPPDLWTTPARVDTNHVHQPTLWWYHRSVSGEKFLQEHPYLSSTAPSQSSELFTPQNPRSWSPRVSPPRGPILRPRPAAGPVGCRPNVDCGQKRRRVMPSWNLPQSSHALQLRDWNEFAPSAFAREDNHRLIASWDNFPGQCQSDSVLTATRSQYQHLQSGPALHNNFFSPFTPGANVVFVSQLLPANFSYSKRAKILSIIRAEAAYLPLCVLELDMSTVRRRVGRANNGAVTRAMRNRNFKHPFGPDGAGWPTNSGFDEKHTRSLPVEIFEMIGNHLPRDSIQSMRLVNREFESKISCLAFKSVVVPFKPKIYETAMTQPSTLSAKSQGKQKETYLSENNSGVQSIMNTYNPRESHVKDGMRVFEEWGPEIKKFALTFEVAEENLTKLKPKTKFEVQNTFWGSYRWPHAHYNRYEQVASLERKADETSAMTAAFSKLTGIRELGLSVLSGLGWLSGKDVSDRAKLFKRKPTIFGNQHRQPDREVRENLEKWKAIISKSSQLYRRTSAGCYFEAMKEESPVNNLPQIVFRETTSNASTLYPPIMFDNENLQNKDLSGVDFREDEGVGPAPQILGNTSTEPSRVVPNALTPEQEDWLMEMEWAQGAFLSSWSIALLDNPTVFHSLRTFNIANLSSKYILSLQRNDIWRALPSLENLTMLVSPDWRQVSKDPQGNISTEPIRPTTAQTHFLSFLNTLFDWNKSIKTLKIGFVDGGEHATGIFARNQNILPAPIDQIPYNPRGQKQHTLKLPHIEHLTLTNCWLAPSTLSKFFTNRHAPNLKTMTFDSVSLTAPTDTHSANHDDNNGNNTTTTTTAAAGGDRSLDWLHINP
ncbi:MAG: hypothetical protein Q9224_005222, partial [Gallowayella concinna]